MDALLHSLFPYVRSPLGVWWCKARAVRWLLAAHWLMTAGSAYAGKALALALEPGLDGALACADPWLAGGAG